MSPDPLPQGLLKASLAVAAVVSLIWTVGLWIGEYAADVLDNVLVGLSGILVGVSVVALTSRDRRGWLSHQAATPKADLMLALESIEAWAYQGSMGWARWGTSPRMRDLIDRLEEEAQESRPQVRRSLHWLQHIATDARLDALGDDIEDLVIRSLKNRDDREVFAQLATTTVILRRHVEQLFPDMYRFEIPHARLLLPAATEQDSPSWDARLDELGPDGVSDPRLGPWVDRAERNREIHER